ncbi:hypothetical protein AX15_003345 [Amanita polypyramis BW_CC]|nr:hypothetical protein AX15_003345 [Amanita polypyramis BW_CC]
MARGWDVYTRQSLDLASAAASLGFSVAKSSTRLGFSIARNVTTALVGMTTSLVDFALFGGSTVTTPLLGSAVSTAFTLAEQITLAPIHLSEYIATTSLLAAHSSINVLSVIFPGSSDASFSLASFITLVKREWSQPLLSGDLPERQYGITQVARAIIAWVALQGITQEWQEERWFKYLQEIDISHAPPSTTEGHEGRSRRDSRVRVTSDVIYPGAMSAQIISADIGEAPSRKQTPSIPSQSKTSNQDSMKKESAQRLSTITQLALTPQIHSHTQDTNAQVCVESRSPKLLHDLPEQIPPQLSVAELKVTLRRLSKIVLAGYGGASLLFFGISPAAVSSISNTSAVTYAATEVASEEVRLTHAIDASEAEAAGEGMKISSVGRESTITMNSGGNKDFEASSSYAWWDILLGKHDKEILERSVGLENDDFQARDGEKKSEREKIQAKMKEKMKATVVIGSEHLMPRFWVLTDHNRRQIVLVLRGTMSLNEIAVDLTCEPEPFEPATSYTPHDEPPAGPGHYQFPFTSDGPEGPTYHVHGGMLRMARAMGDVGKPVQLAVQEALHYNPDFELVLCGHSLGAGVAALLGLMWADPKTCLTVPSSRLPVGRRVYVYCFAPPCLTDANLSKLANRLIVSFVYSHDVVARLSLGSVRDLRNAAVWLCEAETMNAGIQGEGWSTVTRRARAWKSGDSGQQEEMDWFIAVRKTLEANMQNVNMFPPGRVLWAVRENDLQSARGNSVQQDRIHGIAAMFRGCNRGDGKSNKLRLFEVLDVEKVFSQIVFAKDMLMSVYCLLPPSSLH